MSDKTIIIKNTAVSGRVPTASMLTRGELALNVTDKTIHTKDNLGNVVKVGVTEEELNQVLTDMETAFQDAIDALNV